MELVIFSGLQGAGKSSFYRTRCAATHVHVSKDNFPNASNPEKRQQRLVGEALRQGRSVVVDNTNVTAAARAVLIAQGQEHGATVIGYYFASRLTECLERNRQREGKARVPDVAIYATARRLQFPSYAEGFGHLYYVRVGENGNFVVEEWEAVDETRHG